MIKEDVLTRVECPVCGHRLGLGACHSPHFLVSQLCFTEG